MIHSTDEVLTKIFLLVQITTFSQSVEKNLLNSFNINEQFHSYTADSTLYSSRVCKCSSLNTMFLLVSQSAVCGAQIMLVAFVMKLSSCRLQVANVSKNRLNVFFSKSTFSALFAENKREWLKKRDWHQTFRSCCKKYRWAGLVRSICGHMEDSERSVVSDRCLSQLLFVKSSSVQQQGCYRTSWACSEYGPWRPAQLHNAEK